METGGGGSSGFVPSSAISTSTSTGTSTGSGVGAGASSSKEWRGNLVLEMENPFTLMVGQVFTGFGVGCGIGIGVGQPIYFGKASTPPSSLPPLLVHFSISILFPVATKPIFHTSTSLGMDFGGLFSGNNDGRKSNKSTGNGSSSVPVLQNVLSATRGATDIFSGAGRHLNNSLRKLGVKGLEAGVGCGIGIGRGFGVGLAIKPSAIQRIQSSIGLTLVKMMTRLGLAPSIPSLQGIIPGSIQSSTQALSGTIDRIAQTSPGDYLQMSPKSIGRVHIGSTRDGSSLPESRDTSVDSKGTSSEMSIVSRTSKVISSFLQNPALTNEKELELNELAENLRSENNMLHVLLKHQKIIEELIEENEKLRQILVEDLKVSPSKLQSNHESLGYSKSPCSDCFECRRKRSTR